MNRSKHPPRLNPLAAGLLLGGLLLPSGAASLEVANAPVSVGMSAPPNVMFILDDSGSMSNAFMPNEIGSDNDWLYSSDIIPNNKLSSGRYAFWASHCNGVAFNPNVDYPAPVKISANGSATAYPDMTDLRSVYYYEKDKEFSDNPPLKDVSNHQYFIYTGSQSALDWRYTIYGTSDNTTTFYKECMSSVGNSPGSGVFSAVAIKDQSDKVKKNYGNWYSYYRTRQFTMRSSLGHAFSAIDNSNRVGFTVINYDYHIKANRTNSLKYAFLPVDYFSGTQKSNFYTNLYSIGVVGDTPLRGSLARVGRYFANQIAGQPSPIQNSCQKNFAILSTDGYWTSDPADALDQPYKIDGVTPVGQQDVTYIDPIDGTQKNVPRPLLDGSATANTLADMAFYLWVTDLRPDLTNNVPTTSDDPAKHQHLNLYTIGLGVRGTLSYSSDYQANPSASDYAALIAGSKNWPKPTGADTNTQGDATHIDDLWHAAVNGHGQHFSVSNSTELSSALTKVLNDINKKASTGSSAAISAQTPTKVDNWVFVPRYVSNAWTGDLRAFKITVADDGTLTVPNPNTDTPVWKAAEQLESLTAASRTIYFNDNRTLKQFSYANLPATLKTYFDGRCSATEKLSQCSTLGSTALANITGENLVNYLRGDDTYASGTGRAFRTRAGRLGDIINSSPVYVGKPPFLYADAGYSDFVTDKTGRKKMVYVGANDGMLHAFSVEENGRELWAFVPGAVMSNLWRLADDNYSHRYYVDATPTLADVHDGTSWRTILVGGLGAGGRGYYALDVTDPESPPKLLWEYTSDNDANLGLTFGNPIVTKNKDGTWVVAFTSGVNNGSSAGGDGIGRLYVLKAITGELLSTPIKTCTGNQSTGCVGDSTTPNQLVPLNAWTTSPYDNTTLRYYGGDMSGNLWRFDPDNLLGGALSQRIGIAQDGSGNAQPITTKPILTEIRLNNSATALVSVGTGRLLNKADVTDTSLQSIYTVRDKLDSTDLGVLRDSATMVKQTMASGANNSRTSTSARAISWATDNGWYMDLSSSERVVINGVTVNGTLGISTLLPSQDECVGGGSSYLYLMSLANGGITSSDFSSTAITGVTVVVTSSGKAVLATTASGDLKLSRAIPLVPQPGTTLKRTAWRELVD